MTASIIKGGHLDRRRTGVQRRDEVPRVLEAGRTSNAAKTGSGKARGCGVHKTCLPRRHKGMDRHGARLEQSRKLSSPVF